MKKYFPAISVLSFIAIVGTKFLMVKKYCLFCLTQGHSFFGAVPCLKMCTNIYCSLAHGYENFVAAPSYFRFIAESVMQF
jgi:hypothetical protein